MLPIVLSLDDDPSSHILMRAFLEDEEFCEHFISATNPKQGLEILKRLAADPHSSLPSLIFCDIQMPEMSGWEFANQAAPYLAMSEEKQNGAETVIIMLSGTATMEDESLAAENPLIHGLHIKPLSIKLLAELRELDPLRKYFVPEARRSSL